MLYISFTILYKCLDFHIILHELCRKRPTDATISEYDSAMINIFEILMNISREFLIGPSSGLIDESESEFRECICESLVSMGSSNLQCIARDSTLLPLYFQQVIEISSMLNNKGFCSYINIYIYCDWPTPA